MNDLIGFFFLEKKSIFGQIKRFPWKLITYILFIFFIWTFESIGKSYHIHFIYSFYLNIWKYWKIFRSVIICVVLSQHWLYPMYCHILKGMHWISDESPSTIFNARNVPQRRNEAPSIFFQFFTLQYFPCFFDVSSFLLFFCSWHPNRSRTKLFPFFAALCIAFAEKCNQKMYVVNF